MRGRGITKCSGKATKPTKFSSQRILIAANSSSWIFEFHPLNHFINRIIESNGLESSDKSLFYTFIYFIYIKVTLKHKGYLSQVC